MKVAMIGHKQIPSRVGGIEVVIGSLGEELVKKGLDVSAYNRRDKDKVSGREYKGIHIYQVFTIKKNSLDAIVATFFATLKALKGHYDVYHYHAEGPCLMLWLPHLFRKRIVVTIHGLDWQRAKWGKLASHLLLLGEKSAVRYADEIIVLSPNMQKYFERRYRRKTHYIPNGVNLPVYRNPNIIRRKYGLETESYLLFLARIVPEKGLHYLIEAFKKIKTSYKLVIAGDCQYSVEYGKRIQEMCKENDNIILTGFVEGEELFELYSNALVYILPSEIEGMSMSILEAMSYGICCLVSDIPENVEPTGNCAEYFKSTNVRDLKDKLEQLITDDQRRKTLGKKGQEYVSRMYQWSQIADKTIEVYEGR